MTDDRPRRGPPTIVVAVISAVLIATVVLAAILWVRGSLDHASHGAPTPVVGPVPKS